MLTNNFQNNIDLIKEEMKNNAAFKVRYIKTAAPAKISCCLMFCDGLINSAFLSENVIRQVINARLLTANNCLKILETEHIEATEISYAYKKEEVIFALNSGDGVLFAGKEAKALIISAKGFLSRSNTEPEGEGVALGAHEGFVEPIIHNLAMLRRRLKSADLKFESIEFGNKIKTSACICYIEGVASKKVLREFKKRLEKIKDLDILDINAVSERIENAPFSVFKTTAKSERPDVVASKLLEGRVCLLLDGSSAALTLPTVFLEFFQTGDDYCVNFWYSSFNRVLRIICFILTVSIPSLYIGILTFHRELLPTNLLISICSARAGVPLPLFLETILLLIAFDIIKDAGAHVSPALSQSLSIVGALILGDSAVSARFISAPLVIIAAATGLTGLTNGNIRSATLVWRYFLLILGAIGGLYGYIFGMVLLIFSMCSLKSFGVDYTMDIFPLSLRRAKDSLIRFSWKGLRYKNIFREEDGEE